MNVESRSSDCRERLCVSQRQRALARGPASSESQAATCAPRVRIFRRRPTRAGQTGAFSRFGCAPVTLGSWICAVVLGTVPGAVAEEWGNLHGQIIFHGQPPVPAKLKITKDEEECCKHNLVDESLVVSSRDHGLKNVIVFLYPPRRDKITIHPSYQKSAQAEKKLDNNACRFDPHVVLLRTSQTLVVGNSDPIGHNAMVDTQKNPPVNVTIPSGGIFKHTFTREERLPVPVSCSIHPWMRGWVLIRDNPYMAVTDEHGIFQIENLPLGKWEFVFWQEKATYLTQVSVDGKPTEWKRGRLTVKIAAGDNDLGVITVEPELFQ